MSASPRSRACQDPQCGGCVFYNGMGSVVGNFFVHHNRDNRDHDKRFYSCAEHEDCLRDHQLGRACFFSAYPLQRQP